MNADELRARYLQFFESRGHKLCPSDSLVPRDDPTLLFTPAGMNQFKEQFQGKNIKFRRAATCQKCLRTDDIDKVGHTPGHHTFFEMLGNFSFGDYFKKEAIIWAWEFVLEELKLDPSKLTVSIYEEDEEALRIWVDEIGIPEAEIKKFDAGENFWPPNAQTEGPNGPCGPCSEIFYDMGEEHGKDRYVEIWNLVFTEYNRLEGGILEPLPSKNIDTGMGLERTIAVLQGARTNFDTDLFLPIIDEITRVTGAKYDPNNKETAPHVRRIADHARGVVFCIVDGVLPSNDGRGYVVRRLLRRAIRDGMKLGVQRASFIYHLVPVICDLMASAYPEVKDRRENIARIIKAEEERFHATLEQATRIVEQMIAEMKQRGEKMLSGRDAFRLYDTHGLPLEELHNILTDAEMSLDEDSFHQLIEGQREQARKKSAMGTSIFPSGIASQESVGTPTVTLVPYRFLGYEALQAKAKLLAILKDKTQLQAAAGEDGEIALIFDRTPFYGESGGQVGDSGEIFGHGVRCEVLDAQRADDLIIHKARVKSGRLALGQEYELSVDASRRKAITRAHTATHLLHKALREVLGQHAEQAGSLVEPDRFRFDFPHPQRVEQKELREIEKLVNGWILDNIPLQTYGTSYDKARSDGVIALFGEKYGDEVRVVHVQGVSKELCGGTHASATGDIGSFAIRSEASIGAGLRRIEAVVGEAAFARLKELEDKLSTTCDLLRCQEGRLQQRVEELLDEIRTLRREVNRLKQAGPGDVLRELEESAEEIAGVRVIAKVIGDAAADELRLMVDKLREKGKTAVILGAAREGSAQVICGLSKDLVKRGLDAAQIVRAAAKEIGGGGGGRKDMAQAGGHGAEGLEKALQAAIAAVKERLEA